MALRSQTTAFPAAKLGYEFSMGFSVAQCASFSSSPLATAPNNIMWNSLRRTLGLVSGDTGCEGRGEEGRRAGGEPGVLGEGEGERVWLG